MNSMLCTGGQLGCSAALTVKTAVIDKPTAGCSYRTASLQGLGIVWKRRTVKLQEVMNSLHAVLHQRYEQCC